MKFDKTTMLKIARHQLAIDMNCDKKDFTNEGVFFRKAKINEGCRNLDRQKPFFEIVTMGKGIVISADESILSNIKPILENKSREEIFEVPFLYGHSIYYLPENNIHRNTSCPNELTFHVKEGKEIGKLYGIQGFENAIEFNEDRSYSTALVLYAMKDDTIVGLAGASVDCETMWQIGIDVIPSFRNHGLAAYLVNNIAIMIMERGIVPYYCAASSNIGSQATAYKSGFVPAWMSTYHNIFDGSSSYNELLRMLKEL